MVILRVCLDLAGNAEICECENAAATDISQEVTRNHGVAKLTTTTSYATVEASNESKVIFLENETL